MTQRGTLSVFFDRGYKVKRLRLTPSGGGKYQNLTEAKLDLPLRERWRKDPDSLNGMEVEYDFDNGKRAKDVRSVGYEVTRRPRPADTAERSARPVAVSGDDRPPGDFHNPYNFIPTMSRADVKGPLGDQEAPSWERLSADGWSGKLVVTIKVITPLLIPDASRAKTNEQSGHVTLPLRVGEDGLPSMAPTALKGVLRSAYEAVTNSRFGVFSGDHRISYRVAGKRGRSKYPKTPTDLARRNGVEMAESIDQLSPADRLFGWVGQNGTGGAIRGRLRISRIDCQEQDRAASTRFNKSPVDEGIGLPLAILSGPKPQQVRFYVGKQHSGQPVKALPVGLPREKAGYQDGNVLRGRKVYLHQRHTEVEGYWLPKPAGQQAAPAQEYWRRTPSSGDARDDQNRSVTAWVTPETTFEAELWIDDVPPAELGALLWLLDLNRDLPAGAPRRRHRFGGGKPLGFGSIEIAIDREKTRLAQGKRQAAAIRNLQPRMSASTDIDDIEKSCFEAFHRALNVGYQAATIEATPFVAAFLQAATGYDDGLPTYYPRLTKDPDPEGKNYEWFVDNEPTKKGTSAGHSLPDIIHSPGLPLNPTRAAEVRAK